MSNTTIKTQFEFAMMPIQRYEFTCAECGIIASRKDIGGHTSRHTTLCKDCIPGWIENLPTVR